MSKLFGLFLAIIVGICMGIQPVINSGLAKALTPKLTALFSIFTSFLVIFLIAIFTEDFSKYKNIFNIDYLFLTGGFLGVLIVLLSIFTVPILGSGITISIFVTVQLIVGVLIDHYGLFGLEVMPITIGKIFGIAFLLIGLFFMIKS